MPSTRESTQAITRPPGRSTRAISAIIASAARCTDSARSSAMTPSAHASPRKVSRDASAITGMMRGAVLARGGDPPEPPAPGGKPSPQDPLGPPSGGTFPPRAPRAPMTPLPPLGGNLSPRTPSAPRPPRPPFGGTRPPGPPRPPQSFRRRGGGAAVLDHAHHRVARLGGQFRAWGAGPRDVHQEVPAARQPLGQLGARHRLVELPVDRELISVRRGDRAGRMLHGR